MYLFCVVIVCVGASVSKATVEQHLTVEEELTSSPLYQQLLERVDMLERQGERQTREIQFLKAEMSQQRSYMGKLRSKLNAKDKKIQTLLNIVRTSDLNEDVPKDGGLKCNNTKTEPIFEGHKRSKNLRDSVKRIQPIENRPVAFTASLTQHMIHLSHNQNIIFDHVETNVGNAYNPYRGAFIAPVPGIYVFSTSIIPYENSESFVFMKVNKEGKSMMYMRGYHEMVSQTLTFELNEGDVVQIMGGVNASVYGSTSALFTTFSGFLLHQTYPSVGNTPVVG